MASCSDRMWRCGEGISATLCCDPEQAPEHCDLWGDECDDQTPCNNGYTCVYSRYHPVPSDSGVCRFGDLSIPDPVSTCNPAELTPTTMIGVLDTSAIKVRGVVSVDMACEDRKKCTDDNPCCQSCTGAYRITLTDPLGDAIELPIRTQSLACAGNNCGFSCSPLQPGRRYIVWGLFVPDGMAGAPGTLYYVGHCDG